MDSAETVNASAKEERHGDETIFVEADPELFKYLLGYLRHRKIFLPHCVSKAAVLREAAALGLSVSPHDIEQQFVPFPPADSSAQQPLAEGIKLLLEQARSLYAQALTAQQQQVGLPEDVAFIYLPDLRRHEHFLKQDWGDAERDHAWVACGQCGTWYWADRSPNQRSGKYFETQTKCPRGH
ncbi:unnamed protein product [Effrenium voratum]|uniref:Uncharacterized protein n=1 Tax=Effrenium voratum TaxID=2562239 RepID=A0AA36N1S8_9DINO|nr:unnamed protein product [Effrenium voratum]